MMTAQWKGIVAALSPPLAGPRHPDVLIKILDEHVAAGSLVREVDPVSDFFQIAPIKGPE
jgi:hypothetical protein